MTHKLLAALLAALALAACKARPEDRGSELLNDGGQQQINGVPIPRNLDAVVNCLNSVPGMPDSVKTAVQTVAGTEGKLPDNFISHPPEALMQALSAADERAARVIEITNFVLQCAVNMPVTALANWIAPWHNGVEARLARRNEAPPPAGPSHTIARFHPQGFCDNTGAYCCYNESCTHVGTCHLTATGGSCRGDNNFYDQIAATTNGRCDIDSRCVYKYDGWCIRCTEYRPYGKSHGTLSLAGCNQASVQPAFEQRCREIGPSGYSFHSIDNWRVKFFP